MSHVEASLKCDGCGRSQETSQAVSNHQWYAILAGIICGPGCNDKSADYQGRMELHLCPDCVDGGTELWLTQGSLEIT